MQAKARMSADGKISANVELGLIRSALPAALNALAVDIATGPNRRQLQKSFAITIASGSADIAPLINATEPLLIPFDPMSGNYIPFEAVNTNRGRALMIADKGHLDIQQLDDGNCFYAIQARIMYFRAQTMPVGAATIIGNFVPEITGATFDTEVMANLPTEFNDDIVDYLIKTFLSTQMRAA
jgi:hypothetical protein